jgi:arylformamidase
MRATIYDISPTLHSGIAVFPGDQAFDAQEAMSFESGDHLRLSAIRTTVHVGAHADAPSHYHEKGVTMESRDLRLYMGPAQVISVLGLKPSARILKEHVKVKISAKRVLFRTDSFNNPDEWKNDFNSLSPELIHFLADEGVRLVGIDTPSVDPADSKLLESHQALYARDFAVLEGIVLSNVKDGLYDLIALPLKIKGSDASPVRAILIANQTFPELL